MISFQLLLLQHFADCGAFNDVSARYASRCDQSPRLRNGDTMYRMPLNFTALGRPYNVSRVLGTWDSVELSLLAIDVVDGDEELLASSYVAFDFGTPVVAENRLFYHGR